MKRSKIKYFAFGTILSIAVVSISIYSCEKEEIAPMNSVERSSEADNENTTGINPSREEACGEIQSKSIVAANGRQVGQALVYNDEHYFYVILTGYRNYKFSNAYLQVAESLDQFPYNDDMSLNYDKFNFIIGYRPLNSVRKFRIPLRHITERNFVGVAVKVVVQEDRNNPENSFIAWVDGKYIERPVSGRVFTFLKGVCLTNTGVSETVDE